MESAMSLVINPYSIAHRVRCVTIEIGSVIRCPGCDETTFEGFRFDCRRDPLPGAQALVDSEDPEQIRQLLQALLDMSILIERVCPRCAERD
jgi:hypothetical protein